MESRRQRPAAKRCPSSPPTTSALTTSPGGCRGGSRPRPRVLRRELKARVLSAFQERGLWLIDTVDEPVNQLPMRKRRQAVRGGVEQLVTRCVAEAPLAGVIVCHGLVYRYAADPLREAGVPPPRRTVAVSLHGPPARFVAGLRAALSRAGVALAG